MFIKILIAVVFFSLGEFLTIVNGNFELGLLLLTNLILHTYSLSRGIALMRFYHFPFVICIAAINILSVYLAIINVPFEDFQCGYFNYKSLYIQIIFFVIFYFFYFVVLNRMILFEKPSNANGDISTTNNLILAIIMFSASFISVPITDFRNSMTYFSFALLLVSYFRNETNFFMSFFLILTASSILISAVLSTMVWTIIYFMVFAVVIFIVERKRINKAKKTLFYLLSIIALVFVFLYSAVKMEVRGNSDLFVGNSTEQIGGVLNKVKSSKDDESVNQSRSIFWRLTYTSSSLSHVIQETPVRVPFWNGASYYPIFFKFIPRLLWPDKPTEKLGQDFGHAYGLLNDGNLTTSMNAPIITEAFFNFGFFGIILVPIFMAFFESLAFIHINSRNVILTRFHVFFIAIFSVYSMQWESNLSMFVGKYIIIYFLYFFIKLSTVKKYNT